MSWVFRKSTQDKSKQLEEKQKLRELNRKKRKQKLLETQTKKRASITEVPADLTAFDQSQLTASGLATKTESSTSAKDTTSEEESFTKDQEEEEFWYDSSFNDLVDEFEFDESPVFSASTNPDLWSSNNRFLPEGCEPTPHPEGKIQDLYGVFVYPVLDRVEEEGSQAIDVSESNSESTLTPTSATVTENMEVNEINKAYLELTKKSRIIDTLIDGYNKDTVNILDASSFKDELKNIFENLLEMQAMVDNLLFSLNEEVDSEKEAFDKVKQLFDDVKAKVVNNATEVRAKMLELTQASAPPSRAVVSQPLGESNVTAKDDSEKEKRLTLRLKQAQKKFLSFRDEVANVPDLEELTETEIKDYVLETKEWKKKLEDFESQKDKLDVEISITDVEESVKDGTDKSYKEMLKIVTEKISTLSTKDKELKLYSFSKSKKGIEYPSKFSGTLGENVFRFIKQFKEALSADEVRTADEIRTLIKYLDGDAKSVIGEHQTSLDDALEQLEAVYGVPRLIVEKYCKDYERNFGVFRKWGKEGSKDRNIAINKTLDFMRNLNELAKTHKKQLHGEVYSKNTLSVLTNGMPRDYVKKFMESCGHNDSYEDCFTFLFDMLEEVRDVNLAGLAFGIGGASSSIDIKKSPPSLGSGKSSNLVHKGHDCSTSPQCKENWDFLGCIQLYRLQKVDDRKSFLRERKACWNCGYKWSPKHRCQWKNGKIKARCTYQSNGNRCFRSAACCEEHKDHASDELKDWLKTHNVKLSFNMILLATDDTVTDKSFNSDDFYNRLESQFNKNKFTAKPKNFPPIEREALQLGDSAQMMSDDEVYELFTHDMRKMNTDPKIHRIPAGEPVFIFCLVQGFTKPVMCFVDSGANCWLAKEGIPEKEFLSAKLCDGPIPLSVASGITAYAKAEYASMLPLDDGSYQCVRGLTLEKVTGDMPELCLESVFNSLKIQCKGNQTIQNLKIPQVVGGSVDMILGIKYQSIYPEPLHSFPNGLTVFQSKLRPWDENALACIGGPVSCLESLCGSIGTSSTISYMANLIYQTDKHLAIDLFPKADTFEKSPYNHNDPYYDAEEISHIKCVECGLYTVQTDLEKFMKLQDAGLDPNFKCPKCRNCKSCLKGSGKEFLSMKEEFQQQIIEDSISIDEDRGQAVAKLAFISDPNGHISDNENIAIKRLHSVCRKYGGNEDIKNLITKGFQKLVDRKHILFVEDLDEEDQKILEDEVSYTIPWDVAFKEESLSTPARPVFDGSSKTAAGASLNDILAKGRTDLVCLFTMVIRWLIGPVAIHGDISQFYNTVLLDKKDWKFQKVVWFDQLDPNSPLLKGIIRTLIYGIRCVGAQTEHLKRLLQENIRAKAITQDGLGTKETDLLIEVANLIRDSFYVDDGGDSVSSEEKADQITKATDEALATVNMKVKGWTKSFRPPNPEVSDDGLSVGFAGMTWLPEIDCFRIKVQRLHFGKKIRGRFPESLKRYEGDSIEDFVPRSLTRRMCASVSARIYDIPGLTAPLQLRLKFDLRKILEFNSDWDMPMPTELRQIWIENFLFIEEMRDVLYVRCKIPDDAIRCTVRLWFLCDASPDGGMVVTVHYGHQRKDESWSSHILCSKNLLTPHGWTTPQAELHALSSLANLASVLLEALAGWIEISRYGTDSTIAISWTIYEKVRLHVFHRLRVSNIRSKIDLTELYHIISHENLADTGTRPRLLKPEHILPGSEWCEGKAWMKMSVENAIKSGAIKSVKEIKLDNDSKKAFKEGVMMDSSLNAVSKVEKLSISRKVVEREKFSKYLVSPLKWSWPKFVRINGYVCLFVLKCKMKMVCSRRSRNLPVSDGSTSGSLQPPPPKFTVFSAQQSQNVTGFKLSHLYKTSYGVNISFHANTVHVRLTDAFLSLSLEYIYRKTTAEVTHFNDHKYISRIGELQEGILYCKSRIEEGQNLKIVGGMEDLIDLKSFTGVSFKVPVIDYHSPVALSIASHLHYNVIKHRGAETVYRMSLQYVHILGGRKLLKLIRKECIFCQKLLLKYSRQIMSPLQDPQLSISPIFFYSFMDAWGPLQAFCPGYQKATRAGNKVYDVYMLVIGCAATGMINCQVMEGGKNASNVLDALNRFFHEMCVPKIFFVDKDGALMKCLKEGELEVLSNSGVIAQERGIHFETCASQAHSAHGRIERRILMVQEAFERSEFKKFKLHGLGWQTVAKSVEHEVNSIPLGYLTHKEDNAPLLRILTPNFLRLNAGANRAPSTLFSIPNESGDLMDRIQRAYKSWYTVWNNSYVPLLAKRQKWHDSDENLEENDVVYFKLTDSVLSSKWLIGKVESVLPSKSKDKKVRNILISYKFDTEGGQREFRSVERSVRDCVKLWNIEDTTIFEDIEQVRKASSEVLGYSFAEPPDDENAIYQVNHSTFACNHILSVPEPVKYAAVNFGVWRDNNDEEFDEHCLNSKIGKEERELGMSSEANDVFFEITADKDYDLCENYELL